MADHLREGADVTARGALLLALAAAAGCLPAADDEAIAVECDKPSDCNLGAGEVCDLGVCWGDPPVGEYSAVIAPPTSLRGTLVKTAIAELAMAPDGSLGTDGLALDPAVTVRGRVTMPCPSAVPGCTSALGLAGQLRFTRPAAFVGGPRLTESVEVDADGRYQIAVAKPLPGAPIDYMIAFAPATQPIAAGQPSPAELVAPVATDVTLTAEARDPTSGEIGFDLAIDATSQRAMTGAIATAVGGLAGWRVTAEVVTNINVGARQVVSTVATTTDSGGFAIKLPRDIALIDLVVRPPLGPESDPRPVVVLRDLIVTDALAPIDVPAISPPTATTIDVRGVDGSGAAVGVDGATVVVRLDFPLPAGRALGLEVRASTVAGRAVVPLFARAGGVLLPYSVDVQPASGSPFAARYDVPLTVGAPLTIDVARRPSIGGRLRDADGHPVVGASISAAVSAASICTLSSQASRIALGLAPAQGTTNNKGEFTLPVDGALGDVALAYDLTVRPVGGAPHPEWTFTEFDPEAGTTVELTLPAAAHVRGVVTGPAGPVDDATVTIYERVSSDGSCVSTFGDPAVAVVRGRGESSGGGHVAIVLPRP